MSRPLLASVVPYFAGFGALLALTPAHAQPVQSLARVKIGSMSLYSGPGEQMPKCGTLEQGYILVVDHPEGNEFLAVQPPVGSLSWINHLNVELQAPSDGRPVTYPVNALVRSEGDAKLAVGQMGDAKPFNVRRTKLPEGTLVKIVGPKVRATADGDTGESNWYPIIPPRDDFRYVRRADIEMIGGSEKPGFVVKAAVHTELPPEMPTASIPDPFRAPASTGGTADKDSSNNALWISAEKARQENNFATAERLYKQCAEEATKANDTSLANLCFSRVHSIREQQRQRDTGELVIKPLTVDSSSVAQKPAATTVGGSGLLRLVDFKFENKQVYALTDRRGVNLYLVSDSVDLSRYLRRQVELSGTVSYPKEFAGIGLMRASSIDKVDGK